MFNELGLGHRLRHQSASIGKLSRGIDSNREITTVTGLSLQSIDTILDKHYLVRDDAFAISAGDKLAAYIGKTA